MTSVERYSFANCKNLIQVYLPNEVTSIDSTAFKNSDSVRIHCYKDSVAHIYAVDNSIDFVLMSDGKSGILGDTDDDSVVSIMDATMIQHNLAQLIKLSDEQFYRADVDADSYLTILDATSIQLYLVQFDVDLPIGEPVN
jgi:hypothetical protein